MEDSDKPHLGHVHNFGISASIAAAITLVGIMLGFHFIFGFGVFMLAVVGFLSMIAFIEYILGLV